jgi:hypothetical protein
MHSIAEPDYAEARGNCRCTRHITVLENQGPPQIVRVLMLIVLGSLARELGDLCAPATNTSLPMIFKLFRKPPFSRLRVEQDSLLAEELARRVNSIEFQPSKGFLKDQQQPKRSTSPQRAAATQK